MINTGYPWLNVHGLSFARKRSGVVCFVFVCCFPALLAVLKNRQRRKKTLRAKTKTFEKKREGQNCAKTVSWRQQREVGDLGGKRKKNIRKRKKTFTVPNWDLADGAWAKPWRKQTKTCLQTKKTSCCRKQQHAKTRCPKTRSAF